MYQNDYADLLAYYGRGSYDVLQERTSTGWGNPWMVSPASVHAAERACWMLRRLDAMSIRHARRARLTTKGGLVIDAIIVTEYPSLAQEVLRLDDGMVISCHAPLKDVCSQVFEDAFKS